MSNATKNLLKGIAGWRLTVNIIKTVFGLIGASLVLTVDHPYLALIALAVGAGADQVGIAIDKAEKEDKPNV